MRPNSILQSSFVESARPKQQPPLLFLEIHEHRVSDVSMVASASMYQKATYKSPAHRFVHGLSCIAPMCAITYILNFVVPQYLFHCFSRLTHASIITFLLVHPPLCNTIPRHSNIRTCQSFSANHSGFIVYLILHFIVNFSFHFCAGATVLPRHFPFFACLLPPAQSFLLTAYPLSNSPNQAHPQ